MSGFLFGLCTYGICKSRESMISSARSKKTPAESSSGIETYFTKVADPRSDADISPTTTTELGSPTPLSTSTVNRSNHYNTNHPNGLHGIAPKSKDSSQDGSDSKNIARLPMANDPNYNKVHAYLSKFQRAALTSLLQCDLNQRVKDKVIANLLEHLLVVGMFTFQEITTNKSAELDSATIAQVSKLSLGHFTPQERRLQWENLSLLESNLVQLCGLSRDCLPLYTSQRKCQAMHKLNYVKMPTDKEINASQKYFKAALLALTTLRQLNESLNQEFDSEQIDMTTGLGNRNLINPLDIAYVNLAKKMPKHELFNNYKLETRPMSLYLRKLEGKEVIPQSSSQLTSAADSDNQPTHSEMSESWDNPEYFMVEVKAALKSTFSR
jgi:hypothetical protein